MRPRINRYHYKCYACLKYFHAFCVYVDKPLSKRISDGVDHFTCKACYASIFPFNSLSKFEFKRSFFINDINDFESLPDIADVKILNEHDDPFHNFQSSPYVTADRFHKNGMDSNGLSLMHVNLNTLNNNTKDNLITLLSPLSKSPNLIAISETRFTAQTDLANFDLPGYKCLDKDLIDISPTRAGGTALYHDSLLNVIPRPDLRIEMPYVENVWVEIIQPEDKNIIIGVIYRHPRRIVSEIDNFTNTLNEILIKINSESKLSFICGDMNLNLIDYDVDDHVSGFLDMIYSNSFFPCITKPTRIVPDQRPSLIDHIYTNTTPSHIKSGICLYPIADGHLPIYSVYNKKIVKIKKNIIVRDYKKFNQEEFLRHLEIAFRDFSQTTTELNDVDLLYDKFNKIFSSTVDSQAPLRKLSQRQSKLYQKPWLTRGILNSIKNKTQLHKSHYLFGDILMRNFYKSYCNILKKCIQKSKEKYYHETFNNLKNNTKKIWKTINEIVNIKSKISSSPNLIKVNGVNITNPKEIANHFNTFFRNVGPDLAKEIPPTHHNFKDFLTTPNQNSFHIDPCTQDEVLNLISNLSPSNAVGLDNIPTKIIKISKHIISPYLTRIFNLSFALGIFPDLFKRSKIIPVFKADKKDLVNNYRPISILPCLSKILERLMFNRLLSFFDTNNVLYRYQFGFRKHYSTELALVEISDHIYKALDRSEFFFALYLDLSKAFDTVDFDILLEKLSHYGINGTALKWIKSYLTDRTQQVEIDGELSDPLTSVCGVPQGSILGPLLFLIYINDMSNSTDKFNFRLFADDTKIFASNSSLNEIQNLISTEIPKVTNWLYANRLSPNITKTKFVLFKARHKTENIDLHVILANATIERAQFAKHLGVIFDSDMSWKSQCKAVTLKISRAIGILFKLKNYVNTNILKNVYFALVYSHLNYGILSWGAANLTTLYPMQIKQNYFLKVMFRLDILYHTDTIYFDNKLLKIKEIYHLKCLRFMHSFYSNLLPPAFDNFLTLANNVHSHNTRYAAAGNYHVETIHNSFGHNSPSFTGNQLWSQISYQSKSFGPLRFKKYATYYLISRYS